MCKKQGSQKNKSQIKSNAAHIQRSSESHQKEETVCSVLWTHFRARNSAGTALGISDGTWAAAMCSASSFLLVAG